MRGTLSQIVKEQSSGWKNANLDFVREVIKRKKSVDNLHYAFIESC